MSKFFALKRDSLLQNIMGNPKYEAKEFNEKTSNTTVLDCCLAVWGGCVF